MRKHLISEDLIQVAMAEAEKAMLRDPKLREAWLDQNRTVMGRTQPFELHTDYDWVMAFFIWRNNPIALNHLRQPLDLVPNR